MPKRIEFFWPHDSKRDVATLLREKISKGRTTYELQLRCGRVVYVNAMRIRIV